MILDKHTAFQIPVLSLEYEINAYSQLGRPERAAQISTWINKKRKLEHGFTNRQSPIPNP